ncbi:MAG: hypothetical protein ACSHWZ_06145 [Sulfitobacter sp.]
MAQPALLTYETRGRSLRLALIVAAIWAALLGARLYFDAALWIIGAVWVFTLPALWDLASNRRAGLTLTSASLHWHTGRAHGQINLDDIDHIRLDTRLDLSVRATVIPKAGRKLRLPFEATPPHRAFESALNGAGITTQRHHFTLIQ